MPEALTVKQALQLAKDRGLALLDCQLLLLLALNKSLDDKAWLYINDELELTEQQQEKFLVLCRRRQQGEPLAYISGVKEFFGLELAVSPAVLVPRPETETLVQWALDILHANRQQQPMVVDLGTGSGAIACAIKYYYPAAAVYAVDISEAALEQAQANAVNLGLTITFRRSNWLQDLTAADKFDLIVANPPYIAAEDKHLAALSFEPQQALVAAADGLGALKQIAAQAHRYLKPGGWLIMEHGYNQGAALRRLLHQQGFTNISQRQDLAGIVRCSGGRINQRR